MGGIDHVQQMREGLLRHLVGKGTLAAVDAVSQIAKELPNESWLRWQLVDARKEFSSKNWKPWQPAQVIAFIAASRPLPPLQSKKEALAAAVDELLSSQQSETRSPDVTNLLPDETVERPSASVAPPATVVAYRILVMATEWGSAHGGLSTLNRNLCIALAELGHQVACVVLDPSQRDVDEAKSKQVRLIGYPSLVGFRGTTG